LKTMVNKRGTLYLAASIVALTCALPSPALSQDGPAAYFYPSKKWIVEKVDSKNTASLPTCTISNQFNNGFVLQFAGNKEGFTNVNLDVRKATFEKNRRYEVEYSVPGISRDIIPTKAFKENLLVSDLRKKHDFTQSIRMASVIDIKIQGQDFRLYLTGFDAVMKDYAECITPTSSKLSKASPEIVKQPAQNIEEDIVSGVIEMEPTKLSANTEKTEDLDIQNEALFKEAQEQGLAKPPPITERKTVKIERYTEQLAREMDDKNAEYAPEIEPQAAPAPKVKREEKPVKVIHIKPPETVKLQNEAKAITAPVKPTEKPQRMAAAKPINDKDLATNRPGSLLNARSEDLLEELETKNEPEALAQRDVQALASIEPSAPGPDDHVFDNMRNKITELEDKLAMLQGENQTLNEELKATLEEAKEERLSISSNNWNLERATMRYNEAERQIDRLGRQIKNVRMQCNQEKSELERMLFDPELTEQQQLSKLSSLEAELEKTKTEFSMQKRQYEERIRLLEDQLNKL